MILLLRWCKLVISGFLWRLFILPKDDRLRRLYYRRLEKSKNEIEPRIKRDKTEKHWVALYQLLNDRPKKEWVRHTQTQTHVIYNRDNEDLVFLYSRNKTSQTKSGLLHSRWQYFFPILKSIQKYCQNPSRLRLSQHFSLRILCWFPYTKFSFLLLSFTSSSPQGLCLYHLSYFIYHSLCICLAHLNPLCLPVS